MLSFVAPSPFAMLDAAVLDAVASPLIRFDVAQPSLRETDAGYALEARAPGVAPSDISIEVTERVMSIKGETRTAAHTHFVNFSITLPDDADADAAVATSADGVLTVTLPKKAKEEARIAVSTEPAAEEAAAPIEGYYKVAFGPRVLIRASPAIDGEIVGAVHKGAVVAGTPLVKLAGDLNWIELVDGSGYMMISHEKHGVLLEPTAPRPYTLSLVTAGLAPADIAISAAPNQLTATGETARTGAKLHRTFRLPRDADAAAARATCVDGILTIVVPKKPVTASKLAPKTVVVNAPADEKMADAPDASKDDEDGVVV